MTDSIASTHQEITSTSDYWEDRLLVDHANLASELFRENTKENDLDIFFNLMSSTISLKSGLESFFKIKRFKEFKVGELLVHQKGESQAWQIASGATSEEHTHSLNLDLFNSLYTAVKKSKSGQFTTSQSKWNWLPFGGSFIAETFSFRRFNAIWIISREEFLPCSPEEINQFKSLAMLCSHWLESLVELEFSDLRLAEIMWVLERCPLPIILQDANGNSVFSNAAYPKDGIIESLTWINLGKNYELGLGQRDDWDTTQIDVFHKHKIALLGDLFNTLRHELSNPLFGLGLACDLLLLADGPEDSKIMLLEIKKNIQRSQQIIQNLSKLYSTDESTNVCNLENVINEALTLAKSELRQIKKTVQIHRNQTVEIKPLLLIQILFNLLINSAQAMHEQKSNGEISITTTEDAENVFIRFEDNGPGLPQLIKENIFRPFHTTKNQGNGLGLALSRDLAIKNGGDLSFIDQAHGAAFLLTLKKAQ
ncbi:MAG: HAMP domain-containing histidine kinase [Bacteriovoracaceae bacterium]|nr:HAMP domain-containing histidine kinase [Bacteriovoracaceae bacterium]